MLIEILCRLSQSGICVASFFDQFPNGSITNRLTAASQFRGSDFQVVSGQQFAACVVGKRHDTRWSVSCQRFCRNWELCYITKLDGPPWHQHSIIPCKQSVCSRVEQISPQSDANREEMWMATAKDVYGAIPRNMLPTGKNDFDEFPISLTLHQRNNATNRVYAKSMLSHSNCAFGPQISMNPTLNWSIQQGSFGCIDGDSGTSNCFSNGLLHLFFGHVRCSEYIEHGCNVHTDFSLKGDNLLNSDFNIAVNVILESARVRHDDSGIIQQSMHPIFQSLGFQFVMFPNHV